MEAKKFRNNFEFQMQQKVIADLRNRGWYVIVMHASAVLSGMPDLFCTHSKYRQRWLECKLEKHSFTAAQMDNFPKMVANGAPIWITTSENGVEELLLRPCNFAQFMAGLH